MAHKQGHDELVQVSLATSVSQAHSMLYVCRHLTKVVTGTAAAQTPNLQQQQQQYARALQISLCKVGSVPTMLSPTCLTH